MFPLRNFPEPKPHVVVRGLETTHRAAEQGSEAKEGFRELGGGNWRGRTLTLSAEAPTVQHDSSAG